MTFTIENLEGNIRAGIYTNNLKKPTPPLMNELEFKTLHLISDEELADVPRLRDRYEGALQAYNKDMEIYNQESQSLKEAFEIDCGRATGLVHSPMAAEELFNVCWKLGNGELWESVATLSGSCSDCGKISSRLITFPSRKILNADLLDYFLQSSYPS